MLPEKAAVASLFIANATETICCIIRTTRQNGSFQALQTSEKRQVSVSLAPLHSARRIVAYSGAHVTATLSQVEAGASSRIQRMSMQRFRSASGKWLLARHRPCVFRLLRTDYRFLALPHRSAIVQSKYKGQPIHYCRLSSKPPKIHQ